MYTTSCILCTVHAAAQAAASKTKAVQVPPTGDTIESTWVGHFKSLFKASDHIPKIRREELAIIRQLKQGVDLVEYGGTSFVHKYMTYFSLAYSFEVELANYTKTAGSPYIPNVCYVVTHKDINRGMLIEYIPSESLSNVRLTRWGKYTASAYTLDALSDLEMHKYYPQDLKLPNILFSHDRRMVKVLIKILRPLHDAHLPTRKQNNGGPPSNTYRYSERAYFGGQRLGQVACRNWYPIEYSPDHGHQLFAMV